jgi:hypothetical protein
MERNTRDQKIEAARRASKLLADLRQLGASRLLPEELSIRGDNDLLVDGGLEQLAKNQEAASSQPQEDTPVA